MTLTDLEERLIKRVYDKYYAGIISAEDALNNLEQLINESESE